MLNFIKCKELKEAGFPQEVAYNDWMEGMWIPSKRGGSWFHFVTPELTKYARDNNGQYAGCLGFDFIEDGDSKWKEFMQNYFACPEEQRIEKFGEFAKSPALEELIDETLKLVSDEPTWYKFELSYGPNKEVSEFEWKASVTYIGEFSGKTKEEAVANLWLKLNKPV